MAARRTFLGVLAGCALATALAASIIWHSRERRDPIVTGQRMSEWAFGLIGPNGRLNQKDSYFVPREFREAFAANPEAAILWLDRAVNYRHSKAKNFWARTVRKLPGNLSRALEPRQPVISNRWAAILALSTLGRDHPDHRIAQILLRSMSHQDKRVRKVSAYEARPRLWPADPGIAAAILTLALDDPAAEVRRDACRRILESATDPADPYTVALRPLQTKVHELAARDSANRALIEKVKSRFASFWGPVQP